MDQDTGRVEDGIGHVLHGRVGFGVVLGRPVFDDTVARVEGAHDNCGFELAGDAKGYPADAGYVPDTVLNKG